MITAAFDADFSAFSSEVKKAEGDLVRFEGQTTDTGAAIADMGTKSTTTAGPVNTLSGSFRQFDGVLSAAGLHIGPYVKGLDDIAQASGKTTAQLGVLGTAGLAVGTAFAAFNITKAVLEFTGLNQAIGDAVIAVHDFGVGAATAGAKQDVINRAIDWGAASTITYSEAIKFNTDHVNQSKTAATEAAKSYDAWTKAQKEVAIAAQDYRVVLDQISGSTVEAAKFALEHGVNQKTVADAYYLTAPQIAAVVSALAAEKEALKESEHAAQELERARKAMAETLREETAAAMAYAEAMDEELARITALNAALPTLEDEMRALMQAEYDQAVAQDAATQAMSNTKDAADALAQSVKAAHAATNEFIGAAFPTSASLDIAARRPGSMLGFGTPPVASSLTSVANQPWTSLPGQPVHVEPGAFVINYPIMNDPGAMDNLGRLVGDAMLSRITRTGTQV